MAASTVPELDQELRLRLGRRFGAAIDGWFDGLPDVLVVLAERWDIEWGTVIQCGNMSVVIRCRAENGREAVLKVSPDRERVANEAAALASWETTHVPSVLAVDESVGALLIEAIEPGTPLAESATYPRLESLAALLRSLHEAGVPDSRYRPLADRVTQLFDSGMKDYDRRPDLAGVIPPVLYTRGRRLAMRLAVDAAPSMLLHGDLTAVNILDGGADRGLVAIDPAPCLGDPAFDATDLVFWRAEDVETITAGRAAGSGNRSRLQPPLGLVRCVRSHGCPRYR
jgi:streptomycin 6-kinase